MKKFVLLLCLLAGASLAWAGEMQLTGEKFLSWAKAQNIAGFVVDEESFENYADREFTIDFMSTGAPTHLSIKVEGGGGMAEIKAESRATGNKAIEAYSETTVGNRKAVYWTMKTMNNVSFMQVEVPSIGAELRLLTSPRKSVDEMRTILAGFDLDGLK